MAQNLKDFAGRLPAGPRGMGTALKLLMGAGAVGYAIKESVFTGQQHTSVPWFQYPIIYDIRAKPRKISSPTGSKDLQMVNITLRVLSRPLASELPTMYQRLGLDYDERVLPSIVNEGVKSVVAKFNASQLITQRAQDDVALTELSFSREYTAAVESKQVEGEASCYSLEMIQNDK
ncbi:hypothetical protein GDO86_018116 [Hymenochirus boettgeri]|uniref:Prohibitin n=1 Tax=Hymenochirus boettgeri TaxID=247094 RepID=A0A8T2IEZ5_9PIPI|nr:hypothetical protein GDO86_018116 [Hymenochirus boettgeri]